MMRPLVLCGFALSLVVHHADAQAASARQSPAARAHHTLVYDESHHRVLLIGGTTVNNNRQYELLNDLWSFDGTAWTALPPTGDRRSGIRVDADAQQRLYSFGGWSDTSMGDLRVLENNQWKRIGMHPSIVTAEGGFVYDAARNRFVAFGGGSAPGKAVSDVWEYDGAQWLKSAASPPPARSSHTMVYDARRKRIVVFGGMGVRSGEQSTPILGDTWEFDGIRWSQFHGAAPPPRMAMGATYDAKRGMVLVFGGSTGKGVLNDLWGFDGATWKKLAESGPEPRVMGFMAYDKQRDRVVLFGGRRDTPANTDLGDTWEWDGVAWRKIAG